MTTRSFKKSCAIVIATKDRTDELKNLLINLGGQTRLPDEVVIVDSSPSPDPSLDSMKAELSISYIHHLVPSAAVQRNIGIQEVSPDIDFVGILDDDVELETDALENMMRFWETAPDDVAGCGFNWINFEATPAKRLKESAFPRWLGLYDTRRGRVMASGWQTLIGTVKGHIYVDWLPIGASFWRKKYLIHFNSIHSLMGTATWKTWILPTAFQEDSALQWLAMRAFFTTTQKPAGSTCISLEKLKFETGFTL